MEELRLGDQLIRYDREATVAAYRVLSSSCTERCRCNSCRNFAMQRETVYPVAFLAILDRLGIDRNRENDVHVIGPLVDGMYPYAGWFYMVGELVEKGERLAEVAESFQCFFRGVGGSHAGSKAWCGKSVLALEFMTKVPWLCPGDPWA